MLLLRTPAGHLNLDHLVKSRIYDTFEGQPTLDLWLVGQVAPVRLSGPNALHALAVLDHQAIPVAAEPTAAPANGFHYCNQCQAILGDPTSIATGQCEGCRLEAAMVEMLSPAGPPTDAELAFADATCECEPDQDQDDDEHQDRDGMVGRMYFAEQILGDLIDYATSEQLWQARELRRHGRLGGSFLAPLPLLRDLERQRDRDRRGDATISSVDQVDAALARSAREYPELTSNVIG